MDTDVQLHIHRFKAPIVKIHKNFKKVQQLIYKIKQSNIKLVNSIAKQGSGATEETYDKLIKLQQQFQRKLQQRIEIHHELIQRLNARIELYKSKDYSQINRNLLYIEYLTRSGHPEEAKTIASKLQLELYIDLDVINQGLDIFKEVALKQNLNLLINWCIENEKFLIPPVSEHQVDKDQNYYCGKYGLMFECQIQQAIQLINENNLQLGFEIIKDLYKSNDTATKSAATKPRIESANVMSGAYSVSLPSTTEDEISDETPNEVEQDAHFILRKVSSLAWIAKFKQMNYQAAEEDPFDVYDNVPTSLPFDLKIGNWSQLAHLFWDQFIKIYGLPQRESLLTMLLIGGSSLKSIKCKDRSLTNNRLVLPFDYYHNGYTHCPICQLYPIFEKLPLNLHSKSEVFPHPVLLPNRRIFAFGDLLNLSTNLNHFTNLNNGSKYLDGEAQKDGIVSHNGRIYLTDYFLQMSLDEFKSLIDNWIIEDPISFERFSINDLSKVFVT